LAPVSEAGQRAAVGLAAVLVGPAVKPTNRIVSVVTGHIAKNFRLAGNRTWAVGNHLNLGTISGLAGTSVVPTVRTADGRGVCRAKTISNLAVPLMDDFCFGALSLTRIWVVFAILTANRIQNFWARTQGRRGRGRSDLLAVSFFGEFRRGLADQLAQVVVTLSVSPANIFPAVWTLGVANSVLLEVFALPFFRVGRGNIEALGQTPILEGPSF